jgi:two-component system sensor histidine kinase/response regulator
MEDRLNKRALRKVDAESVELARILLDSTGEGIYALDLLGNCTFCNSACLQLLGYRDADELIGKNMHNIMHHTRRDGTPYPSDDCRIYSALLRGEGSHVDDEVVWRADGTSFPVEYRSFPVRENNCLIGAMVTFVDITERRRAQHALQQSEEMFRELAENIREIFFIVTPDPPRTAYISPAYEELFGRQRQELYDRADAWIDSVHPEDRRHVRNVFEQFMQGVATAMEYRLIRPDGSARRIQARSFPVHDSQGKLRRIVGIAEDITDKYRMLEELEIAKAAAEAASGANSEFLANMSYVMRTPINGIIGTTDLVLDTELTPEQAEYLQTVRTSADSLLTIINDILDFSKVEAGKLEMSAVNFDLRKSLEEVMKVLSFKAKSKDLELVLRVHPSVPTSVVGDPTLLRQILINLVGNALKVSERGEVVVEVRKEMEREDHLTSFYFSVRDTGIGIPHEMQQSIFDAFSQADSSSTRRFRGAGLGLAISNRLVQLLGGRIWVESECGHGSTFHFSVRLQIGS